MAAFRILLKPLTVFKVTGQPELAGMDFVMISISGAAMKWRSKMSIVSWLVNKSFGMSDAARDAGLTTPEDIIRYDDIRYGDDPVWQALDVYRPRSAGKKPLPVIVNVHGGGWVYAGKEVYQFYGMNLAQRGFAVVNFSYRLAPEYKFPTFLEDTNAVFRWVQDHADEYGFERDNIFAVGDSAGANILGLYSAVCTNPDYAARFSFQPPAGFAPRAIALNCGTYRIDKKRMPPDLVRLLLPDFLPERGSAEELKTIDVTEHITSRFPPVFLATANGDFLKAQAPILVRKLKQNGVRFVYRCYGDQKNILGHVFHCDIKKSAAKQCNDEQCEFFMKLKEAVL